MACRMRYFLLAELARYLAKHEMTHRLSTLQMQDIEMRIYMIIETHE
jgi:hypothetical protein